MVALDEFCLMFLIKNLPQRKKLQSNFNVAGTLKFFIENFLRPAKEKLDIDSDIFKQTPPIHYDRTKATNKKTVLALTLFRIFVFVCSLGIY
jgi:hypothetical protein